ncbi:MAG: ABC transporter permease [Chloroflexi bacterium]|nr:MAG: ABC transporter permease [Chloroflexota bacterium]
MLVALAMALCVSMLIIALAGADSVEAINALVAGSFGGTIAIARTLTFLLPLTLVALGWIVAFRSRRINVGFEGQILIGGVAAAWAGIYLAPHLPFPLQLPVAVLIALVAGGLYATIAALLWAWRGVNEIISTLMLNFIATGIVTWLVAGPMQEPTHQFPNSPPVAPRALWPHLLPNSTLTWDVLLAPILVGVVWFVMTRTAAGFLLRLTGSNERAARFAGVSTRLVTVLSLAASGALAGLAGSSLILGAGTGKLAAQFSAGFGFDGIVVALVARNNPLAVLPAAVLFAALRSGSGLMEARAGVSSQLVFITQGLVILLVAGSAFLFERMAVD